MPRVCGHCVLLRSFFVRYDVGRSGEIPISMSRETRFKNYLFRLRRMRGYSQKQLAMLIGLRGRKAVSAFEQGRRLPPLMTAMLLEIVLGTKLSEIYPECYGELGQQAVHREDRLPPRFTRHIRGRVLGKD